MADDAFFPHLEVHDVLSGMSVLELAARIDRAPMVFLNGELAGEKEDRRWRGVHPEDGRRVLRPRDHVHFAVSRWTSYCPDRPEWCRLLAPSLEGRPVGLQGANLRARIVAEREHPIFLSIRTQEGVTSGARVHPDAADGRARWDRPSPDAAELWDVLRTLPLGYRALQGWRVELDGILVADLPRRRKPWFLNAIDFWPEIVLHVPRETPVFRDTTLLLKPLPSL